MRVTVNRQQDKEYLRRQPRPVWGRRRFEYANPNNLMYKFLEGSEYLDRLRMARVAKTIGEVAVEKLLDYATICGQRNIFEDVLHDLDESTTVATEDEKDTLLGEMEMYLGRSGPEDPENK